MSSLESSRLHGKIARAIEQVHPKTLDLAAQALSVHYREADEPERAAEYAIKAGERALTFAALEEARLEFQSAIDLTRGDSTQAFLGLAEVELRDGNEKGAATLFRQAADQLIARSENILAARALGRLAWSLLRIVDPEEIAHALDEGMELLSSDSKSEELARLKIQKGNMLTFFFGRDEDAKPILMDAVTVAESVGDKALVAEAFDGLAGVAQLQNQWEDALALGSSAIAAASASGDIEAIGRTHNNHAIVLALLGRTEEALRVLAEGRAPLERAHGRASVAALDVTRAWVAYLLGAPDEVAALTARGQAAWQRWRAYRRFLEVWVAQSQGQFELADSMMRAAWQEAGGSDARTLALTGGDRADRDAGLLLHAELLVHLSNRRIRESIELAPRLIEVYRRVGEPFEIAQAICLMARAFFDANRLDDAQGTLLELTNLRRTFPVVNASALEIEAMISASRGSYDTAREILKSAIDVHVSYGNVGDRARCERLVGQILIKEGSEEAKSQAKAYFRSSLSLADSAGTTHESRLAEGELRSLGIRPRAGRPRKSQEASDGLSPRETEVATLVAAGATNAEIASRLFLSERTVQDHMTHALRKLRLPSRAALASWAVKHGMI